MNLPLFLPHSRLPLPPVSRARHVGPRCRFTFQMELKTGETYRGQLVDAEDNWNSQLKDITCTAKVRTIRGVPQDLRTLAPPREGGAGIHVGSLSLILPLFGPFPRTER